MSPSNLLNNPSTSSSTSNPYPHPNPKPTFLPQPETTPSSHPSATPSHNSNPSTLSPNNRATARQIVVASFNNESDALSILANAATDEEDKAGVGIGEGRKELGVRDELEEFLLIKRGVMTEGELEVLVRSFFEHYHPALVSIP